MAGFYSDILGGLGRELPGLAQPAEKRAQRETQQTPSSAAVRHVKAELGAVEAFAAADAEALHLIAVVADEDKRRAADVRHAIADETDMEKRRAAHYGQRRPEHRAPFAAAQAFLLLGSPAHHVGIESDTRVVQENPAVHFTHVYAHRVPAGDGMRGRLHVERDTHILRKMIERADGHHAERRVGTRERRSHRV